ncbi:MAG: deoxyribodipyrimidine photo-lyase [Acidimicrobiia bacterium]
MNETVPKRTGAGLAVVWFRRDLRVHDNAAWARATRDHARVAAVYVVDPVLRDAAGDHRRRAVDDAVDDLDRALAGGLHRLHGDPAVEIPRFVTRHEARHVAWNFDVTPYATRRDRATASAVSKRTASSWHGDWGTLVRAPGSIETAAGSVPKVFSAFWKRWQQVKLPPEAVASDATLITPDGERPIRADQPPTGLEAAALEHLEEFLHERLHDYPEDRDHPAIVGTSRLSIDLKRGTIGPATVARRAAAFEHGDAFVRQIAWRDWFAHLLFENPGMVTTPLQSTKIPHWRNDADELTAWKGGRTGFPIVDAGMRELLATGYMHNRVRMIVASFLVKDLLVDWRIGERYFRHLLADGDVPQNVGNWQWVAGTGPDAAPFFRVFNPTLQSRRFDPSGRYLRRWVPELAALDDTAIHEPSRLGPLELAASGITLGVDYPEPLVDHAEARIRALAAYKQTKN